MIPLWQPFDGRPDRRLRAILEILRDVLIAAISVGAVSAWRIVLAPVLYDRAAFLLFGLAVMFCSWWGGLRVGLIATFLAALVGAWLFVTPYFESTPQQHEAQVVLFLFEALGICFMAGQLHAARRKAEQEAANSAQSRAELLDLIGSIDEGFQAFDRNFCLTFMNPAAHQILGRDDTQLEGSTFWDQFPGIDPNVEQMLRRVMSERKTDACDTYYWPQDRWLAINAYPFRDGISVLFEDVSDRKNAQRERERLIEELQAALANIRTLRGLVPICAWCKKIRNDSGYWEQLELYLKEHSEAKFTHGMCPDCMAKYSEK
jgi:PAS domain S-box-containing protein